MDLAKEFLQIGEYLLDVNQKILFLDGQEVAAELKTIELLIYLAENSDRYIKLDELHAEVWTGRVVSDTAVRNSIKKLRAVLKDSDLENSQYIKSVPKRGYKLICEVNDGSKKSSPQPTTTQESDQATIKQAKDELEPFVVDEKDKALVASGGFKVAANTVNKPKISLYAICMLVLLVALGGVYWTSTLDAHPTISSDISTPQLISNFPGEKTSLDQSSDGQLSIFTGRTSVEESSQLYLLNNNTGKIERLTSSTGSAWNARFINNDNAVIYTEVKDGNTSLLSVELSSGIKQAPRVILTDINLVSRIAKNTYQDKLLIPMSFNANDSLMVYTLDVASGVAERLVPIVNSHEYDYLTDASPSNKFLSVIRKLKDNDYRLLVLDGETLQEKVSFNLNSEVLSLSWINDNEVLILDRKELVRLNVHNMQRTVLESGLDYSVYDTVLSDNKVAFLKDEAKYSERYYIVRELSDFSSNQYHIWDIDSSIIAMEYLPDSSQMMIKFRMDGGNFALGLYDIQSKSRRVFFEGDSSSDEDLQILTVANEAPLVLLKIKGRLALINYQTKDLKYITTSQQLVSDATFSMSDDAVFYGEKISGSWRINKLALNELSIPSQFIDGYRSIRFSKNYTVLADPRGELFKYEDSSVSPIKRRICWARICDWALTDNDVVWSTFDSDMSIIQKANIETAHHESITDKRLKMFPQFSIDSKHERMIYQSIRLRNTLIQSALLTD